MPAGEDWSRLGAHVRARRHELGVTQDASGGPSKATWYKVENAVSPPFRQSTLRSIERVLGWMPGSVERILDGGEPEEMWRPPTRVIRHDDVDPATIPMPDDRPVTVDRPPLDQRIAQWEAELADIRAELDEERRRRRELEATVVDLTERLTTRRQPDGPAARAQQVRHENQAMTSRPSERRHEEETEDPPQAM